MWSDKLKTLGVNIHVIATGAGANIQNELWSVPGSSAYLSGSSFPYAPEEQEETLGFMPDHFCSEIASVDLAMAAYMKAYKFAGKKPVGLGLTASVASEKIHKGDHRIYATIITDDRVHSFETVLKKGSGAVIRKLDGSIADDLAFFMLVDALGVSPFNSECTAIDFRTYKDNTELARSRFFERPYFSANGKRSAQLPNSKHWALMSGAYNPPHEGHFGIANQVWEDFAHKTVFEITAEPPHKDGLSIQEMLKRAKSLKGYDALFTRKEPFYLDKARKFPGMPLVMGADAMLRMLDPKWGLNIIEMFKEFKRLGTKLYVSGRSVNGVITCNKDILKTVSSELTPLYIEMTETVTGHWDLSSTEIRNRLL